MTTTIATISFPDGGAEVCFQWFSSRMAFSAAWNQNSGRIAVLRANEVAWCARLKNVHLGRVADDGRAFFSTFDGSAERSLLVAYKGDGAVRWTAEPNKLIVDLALSADASVLAYVPSSRTEGMQLRVVRAEDGRCLVQDDNYWSSGLVGVFSEGGKVKVVTKEGPREYAGDLTREP